MILPLLSEKIQKRVRNGSYIAPWPPLIDSVMIMFQQIHHHGYCRTSLHSHIDAALLPEEYGGLQGPLDKSNWTDAVIGETANILHVRNHSKLMWDYVHCELINREIHSGIEIHLL